MIPSIALIVGNGLTIDLLRRSNADSSLDSRRPLSLQFDVPFGSGVPWRTGFPRLARKVDEVRKAKFGITGDFDVFNALLKGSPQRQGSSERRKLDSELDAELRQFLAFAYSDLQIKMDLLDKRATPWANWLCRYRLFLRAVVSFNYDLLLEDLLRRAGIGVAPFGVNDVKTTPLLVKPHGSIDFDGDPRDIHISMPPTYPMNVFQTLNDTGLVRISRNALGAPRREAYIVTPTEYSPYLPFRWVGEGYQEFAQTTGTVTHCVFLGLSYWECDRTELNFLLDQLPRTTQIIEANPSPCPLFRKRVESTGKCYVQWPDKPRPLL